jgi:hypothetical protein
VFDHNIREKQVEKNLPERKEKMDTSMSSSSVVTETPKKRGRRKGHKMSAESKAKMSAAKKGHIVSEETRAKMSASKKGQKVSETTRRKMSKAHRKNFKSKTGFGREQADAIRTEYSCRKTKDNPNGQKVTYKLLAEKYHVSIPYIYAIIKNKIWVSRVVSENPESNMPVPESGRQ